MATLPTDVNRPGPQEDFVSNWEPACGLVEDASLGPRLPLSGSGCPLLASLSPAGDGPDQSQLALLWYSLSPLFCEQASNVFSAVQFSSVSQSCLTLCNPMNCSIPGLPVHHQPPEFTQTRAQGVGDAIQPSHPLSSPSPPAPSPSSISVFSSESTLHMRWPKYWSFSLSISPSNEHPGLISFRMNWLDLFAVQGTLKSLLQHHSPKASIFQHSAFFTVQLSHPYMTTGKP